VPQLGQIELAKLRRTHIQGAYDKIEAANAERMRAVGPATVARIHATLRKALNDAVREGRLTDNPALHAELPSAKRPKPVVWTSTRIIQWMRTGERPRVAVWTPAQTGAFLDYVGGDRLYAYYHLLVFRGPRRGEGIGLRWADLDLDAGVMEVAEQIIQVGQETETTTPKSGSDGGVALDLATVAVLKEHQLRQAEERRAWGRAWTNSGYVFTTEAGLPLHPDYVSRRFERLVRKANQLKLGSQGQAVEDVQQALGVPVTGTFDTATRTAVWRFQHAQDLTANGVVGPHSWYRMFADAPLRPYRHPGYLPPIRLHDLRHGAATLALAAGTDIKVISAMLRHSSIKITADTYTSVLPELAREAAEATARIVPRQAVPTDASGAVSTSLAPEVRPTARRSSQRQKDQVKHSGAAGDRTQDRRIMSPLL
jgi:integrase